MSQEEIGVPTIALKNKVLFPGELVSLVFEREESLNALNECVDLEIDPAFVLQTRDEEEVSVENIYSVATQAKVVRIWKMPEGPTGVLVEGIRSVYLKNPYIPPEAQYIISDVDTLDIEYPDTSSVEVEALIRNVVQSFKDIVNMGVSIPLPIVNEILSDEVSIESICNLIPSILSIKNKDKQGLLEDTNLLSRLKKINVYMTKEKEILDVGQKVQKETQKQVGKFARETMLREQMKAIEKELGETSEQSEFAELREKITKANMPDDVEKKALHELSRLEKMPPFSPESSYIQNYLETLVTLPWDKKNKVKIDLQKAQKILDKDHYGLDEIKERVLEYLSVEKLTDKPQGTILCFFGPPGTGKTSIGESIAKATGREFAKVSLGGIRDENEIRGHRRTYVGAMPGRIIQGLKNKESSNPVFMLDEIDKLGADFRGDPSSALLEVLDPAQNHAFVDHYLDVEYDLSDIIFVTTANTLSTIPSPLLDRMEIIEFSGYTDQEKLNIAKQYLIPRVLEKSGLKKKQLYFTDKAILTVINKYTYESGLRNLERELGKIARKVAKEYLTSEEQENFSVRINPKRIEDYLKAEKYQENHINTHDEVGVTTGLAWTPHGGDILFIETNMFKGDGKLKLTGQLGKVMQESAEAAYSYVKSNASKYGIDPELIKQYDMHLHVPAGAIPKDGPSAGLAMATSLISALSKKKVNRECGMTGEINLRGKALKIGGVKNKVLAAHRAGLKKIILPYENKRDLQDVPENVQQDLTFVFAEDMDDVAKHIFVD